MIGYTPIVGDYNSNKVETDISFFDILVNAEPKENASRPFIDVNSPIVQLGDEIIFYFGMLDVSPVAGYNYSLYLTNGSIQFDVEQLSKLGNYTLLQEGMTETLLGEYKYDTLNGEPLKSFTPDNYTILFLVNSTNRGLLNTTKNFEIFVEPGAKINVLFADSITGSTFSNVDLEVNQTRQLAIILTNNGLSNAFDISFDSSNINEPVGLTNITLPVNIPVIGSFESIQFNFSVTPIQYGIGGIQFILKYSDGLALPKTDSTLFILRTLPNIIGQFTPNKIEYLEDQDFNIVVNINYQGTFPLDPLIIEFSLTSSKINFLPGKVAFNPGISRYSFNGNAIQPGSIDVILTLLFYDPVGTTDRYEKIIYVQTLELIELKGPLAKVQRTFSDLLPVIAIILYFVLIVGLALLYFRTDIRKRFFEQVLGLQLIENVKYKSTSVVIDGSNIAWEQQSSNKKPMLSNLINAHKALKGYGFKNIIIIADAALRYQIDDQDELDKLVNERFIKLVPAKVNADGFILRFSAENGYVILSNDLYKEYRKIYTWIDERRIPYTILDDKFYLHPTFE